MCIAWPANGGIKRKAVSSASATLIAGALALSACSPAVPEPEETALSRTAALIIIEQANRIADANALLYLETGSAAPTVATLIQKHYLLQTPSPKEVLTWALLPDGTVVAKLSAMGAAVCVMVNEIATGNALDTTGRTSCQHLTVKRKAD